MGKTIDFYWDLGSTNSYFALHLIKPIAKKHGATIAPHPFNLGYVFRKQNYVLMDEPKEKLQSRRIDLMRWAKKYDLPFQIPKNFPMKTSPALRGALAMRRFGKEWDYIEKIFAAYWERDDGSVGELVGLAPIVAELGVDRAAFAQLAESDEIRDELIAKTNRGLDRGVFGVPTFFVGEEMFWGKDRMEFIDDELTSPASS